MMQQEQFERHISTLAHNLPYPPTPDIAGRLAVRRRDHHAWGRGLARAALLLTAVLALALVSVPSLRAAVTRFLQIGGIRVQVDEPAQPTQVPMTQETDKVQTLITATLLPADPTPTATIPPEVLLWRIAVDELADDATLDKAADALGRDLPLPVDYGPPDDVYVQDVGGTMVVLVWRDPADPTYARLALHILAPGVSGTKGLPTVVQRTTVEGQPALWIEGPHLLALDGGVHQPVMLVTGNVLLWSDDAGYTYRLETGLTLEEAVRIAESLDQ